MINLDDLMSQTSIFPAINNNTYGKATGNLIKNLLSNLGNHSTSNNAQQKRPLANNYHSLPPIVPAREAPETKLPKPKYIF